MIDNNSDLRNTYVDQLSRNQLLMSADRSVRVGARFFRFLWSWCGAVQLEKIKIGPGAVQSNNRAAPLDPRTDRLWCVDP